MSNESDQQPDVKPFRFSMRTLMLVMTGVCVVGALLAKNFDLQFQLLIWGLLFFHSLVFAYCYFAYRKGQQRLAAPMQDSVTIEVDAKWIRRIRSRWFYFVGALTGVSVSFAPLCLLWCGSAVSEYGLLEWILVPLSFLTIYFVPGFYMRLAGEVIHQLMKHEISDDLTKEKAADERR